MTHSFESGVLEQGNISNVQDRGSLKTRVEDHCTRRSNIRSLDGISYLSNCLKDTFKVYRQKKIKKSCAQCNTRDSPYSIKSVDGKGTKRRLFKIVLLPLRNPPSTLVTVVSQFYSNTLHKSKIHKFSTSILSTVYLGYTACVKKAFG